MKYKLEILVLLLILIFALSLKFHFLEIRKVRPAGDTFNFIFISQELKKGRFPMPTRIQRDEDTFSIGDKTFSSLQDARKEVAKSDEKRLPFYPFLILLGLPFFDPVGWEIAISVIASLGSIVMVYLLVKKLKLSSYLALLAALFLSFNPLFVTSSIRPLSDSLFAFLVISSVYLFYRIWSEQEESEQNVDDQTKSANLIRFLHGQKFLVLGLTLGATALTRWEGYYAAAILMGLIFLKILVKVRSSRTSISEGFKSLLIMVAPFLVIVSPYLYRNYLVYLNPIYSAYLLEEGFRVSEQMTFINNGVSITEKLGDFFTWNDQILGYFKWVSLVFFSLGILFLSFVRRTIVIPLILYVVVQVLFFAWWGHPYGRYFTSMVPLLAIFLASGIWFTAKFILKPIQDRIKASFFLKTVLAGLFLVTFYWVAIVPSLTVLDARIEADNYKGYAFFSAIKYLSEKSERSAFSADYPSALVYLGQVERTAPYLGVYPSLGAYKKGVDGAGISVQKEVENFQDNEVVYVLLESQEQNPFQSIKDENTKDKFLLEKRFVFYPAGQEEWAEVYRLKK